MQMFSLESAYVILANKTKAFSKEGSDSLSLALMGAELKAPGRSRERWIRPALSEG